MSIKVAGKRDGTGPHKDSYQRKVVGFKIGKRQQSGVKCPASEKKGKVL